MRYYRCYILDSEPFNSEKRLKERMRELKMPSAKIIVEFRRHTTGKLDILKEKEIRVRVPKI